MAHRRSSGIMSLAFNQDQAFFACAMKTGLRVYNITPLVEKTHYSKEELGDIALCEMIHRSNWLLVVKTRRPCSLIVLDDQRRVFKAEVVFKSPIRAIRARKDKVAVVLTASIQILSLPSLQRLALVRTSAQARPLCALAGDPDSIQMLVAPAHRRGSIQLLDVSRSSRGSHTSSPAVINCHQTDLVCLNLSHNGTKCATASERGTIIRIWDTVAKIKLHELRRGSDYANIYCINFSNSGFLVGCVSDKGTLHIWEMRSRTHIAAASTAADTRAICAFHDDDVAIVVSEDGTINKFKFTLSGSCHRSEFDYFLQVGNDEEFV